MTSALTEFRIERLHGRKTVTIPIADNRLVLVGENGAGKSTVANLIYYFLTRQWQRVKDYKFAAITATVSGTTIRISHEDLQLLLKRGRVGHEFPYFTRHGRPILVDIDLDQYPDDSPQYLRLAEQLSEEMSVPLGMSRDFLNRYRKEWKLPSKLAASIEALKGLDFGQFLYLPTYRRIEQDLKSIFRGVEIEDKVREFRERIKKRERLTFIELVEFGMEDVERTIAERMAKIKESVRTGLNNLTGTYLREVLRGLDDPATDAAVLQTIDPKVFESIFARIDEVTLPSSDKELLKARIANIAPGYTIGPNDKVIAHFLSKLVALYRQQQASEMDVREFARLCNAYLTGKQLIYDDVNYDIFIKQEGSFSQEFDYKDQLELEISLPARSSQSSGDGEDKLELKMLSSGEKQIVSLFSHIYFSGDKNYFVIIDEPELSLSVPWQQRFLPDIINTGRCTGLIAVTHSPFIWENALEPYVRSLAQFIEPANVVR